MAKCMTPFYKKGENIPLPCGKCPACIKRRVSGWSFRLMKEGERSSSALFVTLTYDPENVPITPKGYMTLDKTDLQKFYKRLRKNANIKYYSCGEYGSQSMRPHYHIILFNAEHKDIINAWKKDGKEIGQIHFGTVQEASIGYTLKYISKPSKIPTHANDDRQPEFALMSKRMGSNYLTEASHRWHKTDLEGRCYVPLKDGKKASMPRYYKEKIYSKEQRGWLKGTMEKLGLEQEKLIEKTYGKNAEKIVIEHHLSQFKIQKQNADKRQTTF